MGGEEKQKGVGFFVFLLRRAMLYYLCERRGAAHVPQGREIGHTKGVRDYDER